MERETEGLTGAEGGFLATQKQIEANRTNALKSTGPTTDEGKQASAGNSLKHGILSQFRILPFEDETTFHEFSKMVSEAMAPVGNFETLLVEKIIILQWRLHRVYSAEAGNYAGTFFGSHADAFEYRPITMASLARYESNIERTLEKITEQLQEMQRRRKLSNWPDF